MNKGATAPQQRAKESISANENRHGLRRGVCTMAEVGVRGLLEALSCPAPVVQLEVTVDTALKSLEALQVWGSQQHALGQSIPCLHSAGRKCAKTAISHACWEVN